ncbi:MAG TPA: hypothetical protein VN260_06625, partial [Dissulfurispiraceae bacterium]|nr:hypothetical protein [Dissulfurispiraceae bacterium]
PARGGRGRRGRGDGAVMRDFIDVSLSALKEAVDGLRKGDFTARPLKEWACRRCHEYAYCPYTQQ